MKKLLLIMLVLVAAPVLSTGASLHSDDAQKLFELFDANGYQLDAVRQSDVVPQIYITQIPHDLNKMEVHRKTSTFIRIMLPNVIKANDDILLQRKKLLGLISLQKSGNRFSNADESWLKKLSKQYSGEPGDLVSLLAKVDIIPPSLAITQSIEESGWGTSHFAIEGNALYGQHLSFNSNGKFLEASGAKVKMAAFDTILQSTVSYMHNLNTGHAYHLLREKRSAMRRGGESHLIDGRELSTSLQLYSEIGEKYVDFLHGIMRHYQLNDLDGVQLEKAGKIQHIRFR